MGLQTLDTTHIVMRAHTMDPASTPQYASVVVGEWPKRYARDRP